MPIADHDKSREELLRELEDLRGRTMEAAETERKRFRDVLDQLPAYLVLLSPDYHVPFDNRFFRERFGQSHGRRCFEYLFHRTEPCENCETYKVLKTGAPHRWEWNGPDGCIYDIYDFPFTDADGSPLIMEVGLDITDRRRAEDAMHAERKRLFGVLETLPPMICLLTPDYRITFANRAFREKFGESNGRHCYECCFARTERCEFCEAHKVLETGQPHHWEVPGLVGGCVIDAHHFPFTDMDGSPMILEMNVDITDRRRVERELEEHRHHLEELVLQRTAELEAANSQLQVEVAQRRRAQETLAKERANLQTIFDVVNVGMLLIDERGAVKRVNETLSRWVSKDLSSSCGAQPGDLVGCIHAMADTAGCGHTPHCASCPIRNTFEAVLRSGQAVHGVEAEAAVQVDGRVVRLWLEVSADPLLLDGGRHVVLALNNITARKQAEEQVRQLNRELEQRVEERTADLHAANESLRSEIAERIKSQEAVSRLAAIVESSDDAILSKTLDGTIVSWNQAAEKL
jgi:PAS domain-containing protein